MNIRSLLAASPLVIIAMAAVAADGWWNDSWRQRVPITIDANAAAITAPLNDVPVLIRLHAGNFPALQRANATGADLRFIDPATQKPLEHRLESFDPKTQIALAWLRADQLAARRQIALYFDNDQAPAAPAGPGGYDAATVAVLHFNEDAGAPVDATAYRTPVTARNLSRIAAGAIGRGSSLDGTSPIIIGDAPQLRDDGNAGWTFTTFIRFATPPAAPAYLLDRVTGDARLSLLIGPSGISARLNDVETAPTPLTPANWHQVALVVGAGSLRLFVDGQEQARTNTALTPFSGPIHIGRGTTGGDALIADLDELTITNTARDADWISFAFQNQGARHDSIVSYGIAETAGGAAHGGHFAIIFQNVFGKKDAWIEQIVIGVCGVMMAIAILIMVLKASDLARAGKSSAAFLRAYAGLTVSRETGSPKQTAPESEPATTKAKARVRFVGDASATATPPAASIVSGNTSFDALYQASRTFGESPLWRVYRIGLDEIRKRQTLEGIDDKAMASVRASLDAVMVRETQRLNSRLVLLTIAISGGPFIGLFGTVVGVMVTFAAIAATGDVNIAAIAPGMAAALLATVAGLGVAIPSLFGYNYLSSRAKDITADMHVFADELLARFNELYGR